MRGGIIMKKYRIDIYAVSNPDLLLKREYKFFTSKEEAQAYARSIANGNFVDVNSVA